MILSHKHRFIFIKGLKVAGTSVEIALSQICGPDDIITPISPVDERYRLTAGGLPRNYSADPAAEQAYIRAIASEPIGAVRLPKSEFYNHMPLIDLLRRVPEAEQYYLLFIERSPYEKVVSFANWSEHRSRYDEGGSLPQMGIELDQATQRLIESGDILKVRNIDRYRDRHGVIRSSGWRYEDFREKLGEFLRSKGLPQVPLVHAKRGLNSSRQKVASLLRPEQISYIDEAFAEEFETFGYARLQESDRGRPSCP